MCRNIRVLHHFEPPATEDEVRAAALQYVRKVSGMRAPSVKNQAAFERAVEEIAAITGRLVLHELEARGEPRDRVLVAAAAKARGLKRDERIRAKVRS